MDPSQHPLSSRSGPADLALDTAVQPIPNQPGAYSALLPHHWNYRLPSGGVLMTVALRAMSAELAGSGMRLIAATSTFCAPIPHGPVRIETRVLRRGRTASQVQSILYIQNDANLNAVGMETTATFGLDQEGVDVIDAAPPPVPRPMDAPVLDSIRSAPNLRFPFMQNFNCRLAEGYPFWEPEFPPGAFGGPRPARFSRWMRYLIPQRLADGTLDPLALPPIADMMPTSLTQKLGPEAPRFYAPSLDLTVHFFEPVQTDWLLVSTHTRRARAGYASAEVELWSEDGKLAAFGTQTMILRTPPEDLPPNRRLRA